MKCLIAFTGLRSGGLHKVLSTNDEIFSQQDLTSLLVYSPSTILDENEWFFIDQFSTAGYENDFVTKASPINTTTLNQLSVDDFGKIKYLCYEHETKKFFQKLSPSQLISKRWFSVSDAPVLENNKKIISFSSIPDAIYDSTLDQLYFRDISKIKTIFNGIEELYREATQEEVTIFLQQDFISLSENYSAVNVKVQNRKRIAIATDRIAHYTPEQQQQIFNYIHEYCPNVMFNEGRFIISSEDDLKHVLFGIDERYYTTIQSNEKRLANSIIPMART